MENPNPLLRESIRQQLIRFDEYGKQLKQMQDDTANTRDVPKWEAELGAHERRYDALRTELVAEEYTLNNMINEGATLKKIEKQSSKVSAIQAQIHQIVAEIESVKAKIDVAKNNGHATLNKDTLKQNYKAVMANLMRMRQLYQELYDEIERETGIIFFSMPQLNGR